MNILDYRTELNREFVNAIFDSYQHFNLDNAIFLAERLRVLQDTESNRLLLAELYIADRRYFNAYHLLVEHQKISKGERDSFLLAFACFKTGNYKEAEKALEHVARDIDGPRAHAHDLLLLGQIAEKSGKADRQPSQFFLAAYRRDPSLFNAVERYVALSDLAVRDELPRLTEFRPPRSRPLIQSELAKASSNLSHATPVPLRSESQPFLGSSSSFPQPPRPCLAKTAQIRPETPQFEDFPALLAGLARPLIAFGAQETQEALRGFIELGEALSRDPWVLVHIGKCYTELTNHEEAERCFREAFEREPYRVQGLEYYSSCLFHLKRQNELSRLSASALKAHYFRPETWIALANCYSLMGDHDSALTFLGRAVQVDPFNSYAHCIIGHEYVAKNNYDLARKSYDKAFDIDKKCLRAIWGIGLINMETEQFDKAIRQFKNGLEINQDSAPFYTQMAKAYLNKSDFEMALKCSKKACELSPQDSYNSFIKAQILFKLHRYDEALDECNSLIKKSTKEQQVYLLLGQVQQSLSLNEEALRSFSIAANLSKKDSEKIKNLIDGLPSKTPLKKISNLM